MTDKWKLPQPAQVTAGHSWGGRAAGMPRVSCQGHNAPGSSAPLDPAASNKVEKPERMYIYECLVCIRILLPFDIKVTNINSKNPYNQR